MGNGDAGDVVDGVLVTVTFIEHEGRALFRLWVKGADGRVGTYVDPAFTPYFWALPEDGADPRALADALRGLTAAGARPVDARVETRRWGRVERDAVRVLLQHPGHTPPLREAAARVGGVRHVLEADVPYIHRYLLDKRLRPMGRVRFRAARDERFRDPVAVEPVSPEAIAGNTQGSDGAMPVSVLAVDIEVRNPHVVPDPAQDPVVIVSVASSRTGDVKALVKADDPDGEKRLLQAFVDFVAEEDPDVIVTYNGDNFDWPYLLDRARHLGVRLAVGRGRGGGRAPAPVPELKQAGASKAVEIPGRANVDLYKVAERDLPNVKVRTLESVAAALGVPDREEEETVPKDRIAAYWDDPDLRPRLVKYGEADARVTLDVARALLPLQMQFARMLHLPLQEVTRMGRGRQVDVFLLGEAGAVERLAPVKGGQAMEAYEGGFVLPPVEGLHENVVALDFGAMYPTLMIAYNISPETFAGTYPEGEDAAARPDGVRVAPEVGHAFLKEPEGFFPGILRRLVDERRALKARLRDLPASPERDLLNVQQEALKVLTNAFYGYMGWGQARWASLAAAEATTAWGRHVIRDVIAKARARGIRVLYGDTDSLFVEDHPDVEAFTEDVNRELPLELDVQERYRVIFFTGAKKRYAGIAEDDKVVVRGLEVRRGDWCDLAKKLQSEVLDIVLRQRDPAAAASRVTDVVNDVREGRVPLEDLTIRKTLTMRPREYKARQAHAVAVERAMAEEPGFRVPVGAKVGYVILKAREPVREGGGVLGSAPRERGDVAAKRGEHPMSGRAKLVEYVRPGDEIDAEYYVDKQIVPAAHRVLEHFGFTEEELKGAPRQKSLFEF